MNTLGWKALRADLRARAWQRAFDRFREDRAFDLKARGNLYRDLGRFMDKGVRAYDCVRNGTTSLKRRPRTRPLSRIYSRIAARMQKGEDVGTALLPEVPDAEAAALRACTLGDSSTVQRLLSRLADVLEQQATVRGELLGAVAQLITGVFTVLMLFLIVMLKVVPQLEKATPKKAVARLGLAADYFHGGHALLVALPWIALVLAAVLIASFVSLSRWRRDHPYWSRSWFDQHVMLWQMYARLQTVLFLSTSGVLLRSGVTLRLVLENLRSVASPWLRMHTDRMLQVLTSGRSEVEALAHSFVPEDIADRLLIYATLPNAADIIAALSEDAYTLYVARVKRLGKLLGALSTAALVAFILATLVMVFSYVQAVRSIAS
ncbi:MAG TPA: type II secretion system F family protein [Rhodanobacteraceae bacterium]